MVSEAWANATTRSKFIRKDGRVVSGEEALKGKRLIGVYCSAHWCPPCRQFTPMLAAFYGQYRKIDPTFEIIFCSSDRSKNDMMSYFQSAHGDYLCYDFDAPGRRGMSSIVNCRGIPTCAIYLADGTLVTMDGRSRVVAGVESVASQGFGNEKKMLGATAFQGAGRSTGAPAAQASSAPAGAVPKFNVDETKETTTLQIVFPDGAKVPIKFNTHHTIGDIKSLVKSRPGPTSQQSFTLLAGFPLAELTNMSQSLKDAGLLRAQVVVKLR